MHNNKQIVEELIIILCLLSVFVVGQQEAPTGVTISLGFNVNLTEVEPQIQLYEDAFESLTSGLTIEETAQNFPQFLNITAYAVNDASIILLYGGAPIYEAIIRSENGTEIIREVFQNPDILLEVFDVQAGNWDPSQFQGGDSTLIITNYILTTAATFLHEQFRNFTQELLVSATLTAVKELEGVDVVGGIQSLIDILDQATSSEGGLSGLVALLQDDDVVQQAVEDTLTQAGIDTDIPALAELTADFFEEVQTTLDMDNAQIVQFFKQVFEEVQKQLN